MKNVFLLFIAISSAFSVFAQSVSLLPLAARAARETHQMLPTHKPATVGKTLDSMYYYDFFAGQWNPKMQDFYTYDSAGKRVSRLVKYPEFDSVNNVVGWYTGIRNRYEYTAFDSISLIINEGYSSWDSTWALSGHELRAFSPTHQLDSAVAAYADWNGNMVVQWRLINSYNAQDKLSESIRFEYAFDGTIWQGEKSVYTYNAANLVDTLLVMVWDTTADMWLNESQTVYTYNGSGLASSSQLFEADSATNALELVGETMFTYDANGRLTLALTRTDIGNGIMIDLMKLIYTYDAQGNMLTMKTETPNFFGSGWLTVAEQVNSYDADGYHTQQLEKALGMSFTLEDYQKYDFFWNAKTTAAEVVLPQVALYMANPTRAGALVQVVDAPARTSLRLLDLTGRVIADQTLAGSSIRLPETLGPGWYMVQLQADEMPIYTTKVLVTE